MIKRVINKCFEMRRENVYSSSKRIGGVSNNSTDTFREVSKNFSQSMRVLGVVEDMV
jgi:hypothetical protein